MECVVVELELGDVVSADWARIVVAGQGRRGLGENDAVNVVVMRMEGDVLTKYPSVSSLAILGPFMSKQGTRRTYLDKSQFNLEHFFSKFLLHFACHRNRLLFLQHRRYSSISTVLSL